MTAGILRGWCDSASTNKSCAEGSSRGRAVKPTTKHIDSPRRFRCNGALGVLRSPHEATCPSIASRFFSEGASMSSFTSISPDKLARLIVTANMPPLIDVRTDEDFAADQRLIPGAIRRNPQETPDWGKEFSGHSAIVVCLRGQ